jgi:glucosamine 6-phosphate synthetase-like amidotransferase/phosphosugar isomerase protein
MKSGFCYSDVKCFVAQILALALVAIWFSDKKTTVLDKAIKKKRKALIKDMEELTSRVRPTLEDDYIETYQQIGEALKD